MTHPLVEAGKQRVAEAYATTPEEYHSYIQVLTRWNRQANAYVESPYMRVDGRVQMFLDDVVQAGPDALVSYHTEPVEIAGRPAMKAVVRAGNRTATGHASIEFDGEGVDATNPIENSECVPLNTEILTKHGFKFFYQVRCGDAVLTHNVATGYSEWQPIQSIGVFKNQPLIEMKTSRFKARCTPNHKWVVENQQKKRSLIPQDELSYAGNSRLILSSPEMPGEHDLWYTQEAATLGWLFTDGQITRDAQGMASTAYVRQSKEQHFKDLEDLFGCDFRTVESASPDWLPFREWTVQARHVREILSHFRVNNSADLPAAIAQMSVGQSWAFFHAAMCADGSSGSSFGKTDYAVVEAVQIAAAKNGIKTGPIKSRVFSRSTKPFYSIAIHKTQGAYLSEITVAKHPPSDVWCPTVANGTWFARQGGQVWITGNTSAIGRALGFLGYGLLGGGIASADEVEDAHARSASQAQEESAHAAEASPQATRAAPMTVKQQAYLKTLLETAGYSEHQVAQRLASVQSRQEASELITTLRDGIEATQQNPAEAARRKAVTALLAYANTHGMMGTLEGMKLEELSIASAQELHENMRATVAERRAFADAGTDGRDQLFAMADAEAEEEA